jgi:phenylpropionate dioxygenase-like ring-hydroxylating dioxygenase large terminal subunit
MHRGQRLVHGDAGSGLSSFTCPYHGWKWGLSGELLDVQDPENFSQGNPCGKLTLKTVRCETWGGFIWYSMDPDAKPLLEYLAPIPDLLGHRKLEQMHRVVRLKIRVNTNWKFAPDNFNESYHLPAVHPQMRSMIDEDYKNTLFDMYPMGHNRMIEQGQPSLRADHPNEVEPVWQDMLREWDLDPETFAGRARDGRVALQQAKRQLGKARGYDYFDDLYDDELTDYFHHTLFPNVTITGIPDGAHVFRTEPDPNDPEWCTFDYWYLAPRINGRDEVSTLFGPKPYAEAKLEYAEYGSNQHGHYLGDFIDQDLSVAVTQQQGFHSRAYEDAYLSDQEGRVRRFHEVLNDYLAGRR